MKRSIYDEDHEAFRASVREFLERSVIPHVEEHARDKALPREFWLEAGKQGFLGLEIPEEYGGVEAGDYRFNAVLRRGARTRSTPRWARAFGIHADIVAPYLVELDHARSSASAGCPASQRRDPDRDRDDRAVRRLRPRGAEDHRGPRRRRLGHQRLQDLHHQRLLRRPGRRRGAHRPGEEGARHHALRRRDRAPRASPAAASSTRSARTSPTPPSCSSRTSAAQRRRHRSASSTAASST